MSEKVDLPIWPSSLADRQHDDDHFLSQNDDFLFDQNFQFFNDNPQFFDDKTQLYKIENGENYFHADKIIFDNQFADFSNNQILPQFADQLLNEIIDNSELIDFCSEQQRSSSVEEIYNEIYTECESKQQQREILHNESTIDLSRVIEIDIDRGVINLPDSDSDDDFAGNDHRKKSQNRKAASRYRRRRKLARKSLSQERQNLERENSDLKRKVDGLRGEIDYLKKFLAEIQSRK